MRVETRQNTFHFNLTAGVPYELLGPNPSRKSFIFSPVAGGSWDAPGYISLDHRSDVIPGAGALNFITGWPDITVLTDCEIGDAIGLPWWVVSTYAVCVQIVEYSYVNLSDLKGR